MTATGAQAIMPGKVRATDRRAVLWPPYGEAFWGLRGLRLFSNLSQAELRELSPLLRRETHPRGEFLFHMGDKADRLYFLERGTVKAVVLSPDGDERILDVFRAGDLFGELFFMTVARRIFAAQAVTAVTVYAMAERAFTALLERRPDLARNFIRHLARQYRRATLRLQALLSASAGLRLLAILLDLGERIGRRTRGRYVLLDGGLTQGDLAQMAGLHRSTVSTLINAYRRQGILGGRGTRLRIHRARAKALLERTGVPML